MFRQHPPVRTILSCHTGLWQSHAMGGYVVLNVAQPCGARTSSGSFPILQRLATILIISSIVKRLLWRASPLAMGPDFIQGGQAPLPPPPSLAPALSQRKLWCQWSEMAFDGTVKPAGCMSMCGVKMTGRGARGGGREVIVLDVCHVHHNVSQWRLTSHPLT